MNQNTFVGPHIVQKYIYYMRGLFICLTLIMVFVWFWTKSILDFWIIEISILVVCQLHFLTYQPTYILFLVVHFLVNKFKLKNSILNYIFKNRLLIQFYLNHMDKKHWKQFTGFYVTIQNGFKKLWVSQSEVWILWLKNLQTWVEMMDLNFYHGKMIFSGKLLSFSFG